MKGRDSFLLFRSVHGAHLRSAGFIGLKPACCTRRGSRFAYPNRSRDHLRLSPEAGLRPGAGQKVRTAFTRPERPDGSKNSVFPVYAGSRPNRAIGIKRVPKGIARRQSRTGQGRNGRKGSPLPSSGPSAAPAPISRHRFHLCRAVAMFDSGPSRRRPQTDAIAGSPGRCKGVTESLPAPPARRIALQYNSGAADITMLYSGN
jgi:hypothetical protein